MAKSTLTPFSKCTGIMLISHDGENDVRQILDISPTMKNITHCGKKYFRIKDARSSRKNGEPLASYLWDGWVDSVMAKERREKEKSEACSHAETEEGPKTPLRYGSSGTEICKKCQMWRTTIHPNGQWRNPPVDTNFDDGDD